MDAIDILWRLEKAFKVKKLPIERLFWSGKQRPAQPLTVGQLHQRLRELLKEAGVVVPDDSWERGAVCVGGALSIAPASIRPENRLIEDLGGSF